MDTRTTVPGRTPGHMPKFPDCPVCVQEHGSVLVYVDDFLAAGPREILRPLLTRLLDVWKGSNPDYLGRQPGDVDAMRVLYAFPRDV